MTIWIDVVAAARAARVWARWGDDVAAARIGVASWTAPLALDGRAAWVDRSLASAAGELWATSGWLHLVLAHVGAADTADVSLDTLNRLLAAGGVRPSSATSCPAPLPVSALAGDRGGTFDVEPRSPYDVAALDQVAAGRALVMRALRDTASLTQIHPDEFEVVELTDGRFLVVLPGVVDLSAPDLGYDEHHRSVRDLDREAFASLETADVADNGYARMVRQALLTIGVPEGSELVLVGHSFGADTALDLAADAGFNGPSGFRVTHVVAAAYDSGPQLAQVPEATRVLVLQNRDDAVVIAEKVGRAHVADAIEAHVDAIGDVARLDLPGFGRSAGSAIWHDTGALAAGVSHLVEVRDDLLGAATALLAGDLAAAAERGHAVVTPRPGVTSPTPAHVSVVFDGRVDGAGHHQQHYLDYLAAADDPAVTGFLSSLVAGRRAAGTARAVDISVPASRPRTEKT